MARRLRRYYAIGTPTAQIFADFKNMILDDLCYCRLWRHHSRQVKVQNGLNYVLSFCKKLVGRPLKYISGDSEQVSYRMTEIHFRFNLTAMVKTQTTAFRYLLRRDDELYRKICENLRCTASASSACH
jgi:hypothetical protein